MQLDLVIRGASVVTSLHAEVADIGMFQGRIAALGNLPAHSAPVEIPAHN